MLNLPLTPDDIREKALDILAGHRAGIKQADLFKKTETTLSADYVVPSHAVKNALWDLADRYESYVVKKKASYRDVWLYPTEALLEAVPLSSSYYRSSNASFTVEESNEAYDAAVDQLMKEKQKKDEEPLKLKQEVVAKKFLELYRHLEFSGILMDMADIQLNFLNQMTPSDQEDYFKLKFAFSELRRVRNNLVHK